jgi:GTP:adenosylcobinamide-phosphate guanylyltransferase
MTAALVLAGTRKGGDALADHAGVTHKALIPVGGEPMLGRVVAALKASGRIDRILVSINRPKLVAIPGVETIRSAKTLSESVIEAMRLVDGPLLITTADHALLQPDWVRHFLDRRPAKNVVVGVARAEAVMAAAPDTKRTFLKFADASYSGCNLFHLEDVDAERAIGLWREFEQLRKKPLQMLKKLGPGAILAYATGRLTVARVVAEVERIGGLTAGVVEMPDGRAAIDVDKPEDLELVRRLVGEAA